VAVLTKRLSPSNDNPNDSGQGEIIEALT